MRILVVHNQLWAHYKSVLFEEIHRVNSELHPESTFLVGQIALYEKSRIAMASDQAANPYQYPYQVLFQKSLDSVSFSERLRALFRLFHGFRPDVLNITGYFDYAQVLLLLYAKLRGVKTVISTESSESDKLRTGVKEGLKRVLLRQADAFFCFGTSTVNYLRSLGVEEDKIRVRKAAVVDNEQFLKLYRQAQAEKGDSSRPAFIYVGRLAPEKNLIRLIQAFEQLQEKSGTFSWDLILVGDGPDRDLLKSYVEKRNLDRITFTGGVGWQHIPYWLSRASVLVLPSLSEPWGLVVNEALLCGMPVIVSKKSGCADDLVEHGKNGFLIDPEQVESLVEAMRYYQENPAAVASHGARSVEIIAPFSPKAVAMEMVRTFHNL